MDPAKYQELCHWNWEDWNSTHQINANLETLGRKMRIGSDEDRHHSSRSTKTKRNWNVGSYQLCYPVRWIDNQYRKCSDPGGGSSATHTTSLKDQYRHGCYSYSIPYLGWYKRTAAPALLSLWLSSRSIPQPEGKPPILHQFCTPAPYVWPLTELWSLTDWSQYL